MPELNLVTLARVLENLKIPKARRTLSTQTSLPILVERGPEMAVVLLHLLCNHRQDKDFLEGFHQTEPIDFYHS